MKRVLVLLVVACGSRSTPQQPPPPKDAAIDAPLDRDLATLAARSVAMYRDIVAALATAGERCDVATAQVTELAQRHADVIAANAKVAQEDRGAQLQAALKPHDAELAAAAQTIVSSPTLAACAMDPAFDAAWGQLVGAPTAD